MREEIKVYGIIATVGWAILAISIVSLLAFPTWRNSPFWWLGLPVAAFGVFLSYLEKIYNIIGRWKEITPEERKRSVYTTCSPEEYKQRRAGEKGWKVGWVNRGATATQMVKEYGRLMISGKMKAGKTREAIELIQQLISEGGVLERKVYEPTQYFNSVDSEELKKAAQEICDPREEMVWFIDDLPKFCRTEDTLNRMEKWIGELECCRKLYVIATGRSDELEKTYLDWLKKKKFSEPVTLGEFSDEMSARLIDRMGMVFDLKMDEDTRKAFLKGLREDSRPERLKMAMIKMRGGRSGIIEVDAGTAEQMMKESLLELWRIQRAYYEDKNPWIKHIMQALDICYAARVRAFSWLAIEYGMDLVKKSRGKGYNRFVPRMFDKRNLGRAWKELEKMEVREEDGSLKYNEASLEGRMEEAEARKKITEFLVGYELTSQDKQDDKQLTAWVYFDLAIEAKTVNEKIWLYSKAIQRHDHVWFYNNRGLSYAELGKHEQAIANFEQAIHLDANDPAAYNNRGLSYAELGKHEQAIADYEQAIHLDANDPAAYNNRCLSYHKLGKHEQAKADHEQAIRLDPKITVMAKFVKIL